mgnify:CR=1 FL=1
MIRTENLRKVYQQGETKIPAVDGVSLQIEQGEFIAIVGKSGSGKSTLLHLLGGLDTPTAGSVFYDDVNLSQLKDTPSARFRRVHIGFVFQEYHLIPELTVRENIIYPALLAKKKVDEDYLGQLISTLELDDRVTHLPSQLSGGQQQRTAVARAFINQPEVVLCDEPTGNLDSHSGKAVMEMIASLRRQFHQTVVVVTHDMEFAQTADRILTIRDGKIVS